MMEAKPLRERLVPQTALTFPGFTQHDDPSWPVAAYALRAEHCHVWYRRFATRVLSAVGSGRHLPVYRISDGEFRFMVGPPTSRRRFWRLSPSLMVMRGREITSGTWRAHRSGASTYGYERYTPAEWAALKPIFAQQMQNVARDGILAIVLHDTEMVHAYIPEVFDWFDGHQIELSEDNYHHMYSVYVLLHGPDRIELLRDRRVLVVTSRATGKYEQIERGLLDAGVRSVQFLPISAEKSLLEKLDLSRIRGDVDLALVGAGIGSVNCLEQLQPLGAVCVDVGFCLSTIADSALRFHRPYCVPDDEFEGARMHFEWRASPFRRFRNRLRQAVSS